MLHFCDSQERVDDRVFRFLQENPDYQQYIRTSKIKMVLIPLLGCTLSVGYGYICQPLSLGQAFVIIAGMLLFIAMGVLQYLPCRARPVLCEEAVVHSCIERKNLHVYHVKNRNNKYHKAVSSNPGDTIAKVFQFQEKERVIVLQPSPYHGKILFHSNIPEEYPRFSLEEYSRTDMQA